MNYARVYPFDMGEVWICLDSAVVEGTLSTYITINCKLYEGPLSKISFTEDRMEDGCRVVDYIANFDKEIAYLIICLMYGHYNSLKYNQDFDKDSLQSDIDDVIEEWSTGIVPSLPLISKYEVDLLTCEVEGNG